MIPTRPFRLCHDSNANNVSAAAIQQTDTTNAECPHGVVLCFPPPAPYGSSQVPSGSPARGPLPPGRRGPAASPAPPSRCSRRSPGGNERLAALSGGAAAARGRPERPPAPPAAHRSPSRDPPGAVSRRGASTTPPRPAPAPGAGPEPPPRPGQAVPGPVRPAVAALCCQGLARAARRCVRLGGGHAAPGRHWVLCTLTSSTVCGSGHHSTNRT